MITKKAACRRRLAWVSAAAVLALSLFIAACGEDDSDGGGSTPEQLELTIAGPAQTVTLVDNPGQRVAPPGSKLDQSKETPGDIAIQDAPVLDPTGEKVGRNRAVFTTVGEPGTEMVTATISLDHGEVALQGMIGEGSEDTIAIIGGTGEYDGARGTATISQDEETVRLLLDFRE